jgi:hypothetical protein
MHLVRKAGHLAREFGNRRLPLRVLQSANGYYIGTADEEGPYSRESVEYWQASDAAHEALRTGTWTQRDEP